VPLVADNMRSGVYSGLTCNERSPKGTILFAYICMEHIRTGSPDCIIPRYSCNMLCSPVKRGDSPIKSNGKYTFIDRIENNITCVFISQKFRLHSIDIIDHNNVNCNTIIYIYCNMQDSNVCQSMVNKANILFLIMFNL